MTKPELKTLPMLERNAELVFRAAEKDGEEDTVELSFSSEEPYQRWFGMEVLGHKDTEVDMSWMASGRAPLLVDHKKGVDDQVGIITKAWIEGGRGKAIARFGKDKRSQKIKERVKAGDLTNISVGYRVLEMELVKSVADGPDTYRVTRWQPMENSIVTIPADQTVGVGRKASKEEMAVTVINRSAAPPTPAEGKPEMTERTTEQPAGGNTAWQESYRGAPGAAPETPEQIQAAERKRIAEITALGKRFNRNDIAEKHIGEGTSLAAFNGILIKELGADTVAERNEAQHNIGLTKKEARQFSFLRMIGAIDRNATKAMREAGKFEMEAIEAAIAKRGGGDVAKRGVAIPMEVLRTPLMDAERALNVGTPTAGGNLVATNLLSQDFITLLRNKMVVQKMGAWMLSGLDGFVAIPRQSGGGTSYWVAEAGAPTATQQTVDQVSLSPKTIGAYTDLTRRLLLQSSLDAEALVRNDLAAIIALGIDLAALSGSGSGNQPLGVSGQSGITAIALGTNGANPAWADVVNMETQVAVNNADLGNMGYISNPKVRGKLKGTLKAAAASATMIWDDARDANGMGSMNGYKAAATNQARSNLTKGTSVGVCSEIFFGNWNDLIIGQWSGLDMLVDPYSNSTSGTLRVTAFMDVDVGCRHGQSFSYIADALTT